jgi:hypothetical protein
MEAVARCGALVHVHVLPESRAELLDTVMWGCRGHNDETSVPCVEDAIANGTNKVTSRVSRYKCLLLVLKANSMWISGCNTLRWADNTVRMSIIIMHHYSLNQRENVYFTPSTMGGGLLNPFNYETVYSTPWTFQNRSNYPQTVLKWRICYSNRGLLQCLRFCLFF